MNRSIIVLFLVSLFCLATQHSVLAQKGNAIKLAPVTYTDGTTTMIGFIAYDSSYKAKRPAVLIAPEWWGVTDYVKSRAKQLAALGYVAFVVDYYGNGAVAENPDEAMKLATPFYKDPELAKKHFDAALTVVKSNKYVNPSKIAAIGYCFGGAMGVKHR